MSFFEFVQVFGFILILLYLLCGIDDTIWFLLSVIVGFFRKKDKDEELDFNALRNTPPKMLAVSIAAWHEANVIGDVIANFVNTTDYPKSMYHLFVGVYPNDPDTIHAVEEAGKLYPNVHAVINCKEGPTTKAQNLNHVIRQIKEFERKNHVRFASLTVHDSEDVIHTYELLATNYLIDKHPAIQFPVFPIMKMPRFGNFFKQITTATYADEFAENHYIALVERRNMKAFVPCAGTGFALSRETLEAFGDEDVLPSESLTEDYLLSLNLYKKGIPLYYVLNKFPRVMQNGKVKSDFITTRSLFPNTFKTAVKQKTRWTYGITMQSIGLKDIFRSKGVSFLGRYSFYKDAKVKIVNLIPFFGYIASVYCIAALFTSLPPLYTKDSPVYYMAIAVFTMMIIRQIFRGYALYHVYGFRSVFFGCLLPPLFPIRLIYGNIINFTATFRAFKMKFFGDKKTNKIVNKEHKQKAKKEVKWAKTDHDFLSKDQLRRYRRLLGDTLIVQGNITPKRCNEALKKLDREHGEQLGTYLVRHGDITEEEMMQALAHVVHVPFIPAAVLRKLDYADTLKQYDRKHLKEWKILPLTEEDGSVVIGICNATTEENIEAFRKANKDIKVKRMLLQERQITDAIRQVARKAPKKLTDALLAYHVGILSYEQAVLVCTYAEALGTTEQEMMAIMGIGREHIASAG
ncbi:MAG: phage adsorption protein NrfB [Lachnospiraceae bacterium]|nr:phage adsorption protein NrfB [Lachnospiraceae bacterium]